MAKDAGKSKAADGEEVAEEVTPSKKKKESAPKKEGSMSLVVMIGGALGGVVLIILSVIIGTIIANKLFPPTIVGGAVATEKTEEKQEDTSKKKLPPYPEDDSMFVQSNLLTSDFHWNTFKSGRITTNVKNSTDRYVVIELTIDYSLFYKEELIAKGFATDGGKDKDDKPLPPVVDTASAMYQKLKLSIINKINDFLSSYTDTELQTMRPELRTNIKNALKPTFKEFGLLVGEINIVQFIFAK